MVTNETDITDKLEACGIKVERPIVITETDKTYPIKPELWDNWFPFAYLAFKELALRGARIKSFATVGTGNGVDAIGAAHIFDGLETIVLTDLEPEIVEVSAENVRRNTSGIEIVPLVGSLLEPLIERKSKVDVVYENLPNIPDTNGSANGYKRASRFDPKSVTSANIGAQRYLLLPHYAFLQKTRDVLLPDGTAVLSIGGRVPYEVLRKLVENSGHQFSELVAGFKRQTEPWEVLHGYAEAERRGIEFDFYMCNETIRYLKAQGFKEPFADLDGITLKTLIEPFKVSAREALRIYEKSRRYDKDTAINIGHTVHIIRARKQ